MTKKSPCRYSSNCRIYEINSASALPRDEEFVRNCCHGPDRDYCPIYRYHQALRHPTPSGIPRAKEATDLHLLN